MRSTPLANEDRPSLGIVMMLVAWFTFALIDTSVKWMVLAGLSAMQLAFMRYFWHLLISFGLLVRSGGGMAIFATAHPGLVVLRGLLLSSATMLNFFTLKFLPLTVTSAIMFSSPIVVCMLSWPLLGERVGPWRWFAITLGFVGVLVVIRPFGAEFHWAAILTVYNAFALAFYSILTRKLSDRVSAETMQFYMALVGTVTTVPLAVLYWQPASSTLEWVLMVAIGVWGWAGHELLTRAHRYAPANTLMPYTYSFMIYLTIATYLVFGDVIDFWTTVGAAIIVVSGLIIWKRAEVRAEAT